MATNKGIREIAVFLIVIITISFSVIYTGVKNYDLQHTSAIGYTDCLLYLDMYFGRIFPLQEPQRCLIPFLARLLPDPPTWIFTPGEPIENIFLVVLKFGLVNFFFLIGACLALYILEKGFSMNYFEAFLGVLMFLGSKTIMASAGFPMVDVAFFFFFLLCLIAIQRNNWWLLLLSHTIGMFAKELVILSVPLILVTDLPLRRKIILLLCLVPGIIVFILFRLKFNMSLPGEYIMNLSLSDFARWFKLVIYPNKLLNLFLSFGLFWIPAIRALFLPNVPVLLKRWFLILFAVISIGMAVSSSVALNRFFFYMFPAVIPLASICLAGWLKSER